mmetsp:Transcript_18481/g.28358  ORF Transcript_18481/g.28358 Transcript_18481/m.28358 type:complete len:258 (-) Transcript_18481:2495-3268(-)
MLFKVSFCSLQLLRRTLLQLVVLPLKVHQFRVLLVQFLLLGAGLLFLLLDRRVELFIEGPELVDLLRTHPVVGFQAVDALVEPTYFKLVVPVQVIQFSLLGELEAAEVFVQSLQAPGNLLQALYVFRQFFVFAFQVVSLGHSVLKLELELSEPNFAFFQSYSHRIEACFGLFKLGLNSREFLLFVLEPPLEIMSEPTHLVVYVGLVHPRVGVDSFLLLGHFQLLEVDDFLLQVDLFLQLIHLACEFLGLLVHLLGLG